MSTSDQQPDYSDEEKLDALRADVTPGVVAEKLRENAVLLSEIRHLKRQNLRLYSAIGALILIGGGFTAGMVGMYPKYRWIPTQDARPICEAVTEGTARLSLADITDYAKDAVLNSYSYDYVNYRPTINRAASQWFTSAGRAAFLKSLDVSGNLERVISGRLILRSMASQVPQLEEEGFKGATPYWVVHVPITIEFYSRGDAQPASKQDYNAVVTLVQIPATATNLKGISVDSLVLAPRTGRR